MKQTMMAKFLIWHFILLYGVVFVQCFDSLLDKYKFSYASSQVNQPLNLKDLNSPVLYPASLPDNTNQSSDQKNVSVPVLSQPSAPNNSEQPLDQKSLRSSGPASPFVVKIISDNLPYPTPGQIKGSTPVFVLLYNLVYIHPYTDNNPYGNPYPYNPPPPGHHRHPYPWGWTQCSYPSYPPLYPSIYPALYPSPYPAPYPPYIQPGPSVAYDAPSSGNGIALFPSAPPGQGIDSHYPDDNGHWKPTNKSSCHSLNSTALVAGYEGWDGSLLWVIRARYGGDLIPGKLAAKHRSAFISFNEKDIRIDNFEILCISPELVRWKPASMGEVPPNALVGGQTGTGEKLYIGRASHELSLTPGKIMASNQYPQSSNVAFVHPAPPPSYQQSTVVTTSYTQPQAQYYQPPPPAQYYQPPPPAQAYHSGYPIQRQAPPVPFYPTSPIQPVVAQTSQCVTSVTRPAPGVKVVNHQYYNTPAQTHVVVAPQEKRGLFSRSWNKIENTLDNAMRPSPPTNKTVIVTQKNGAGSSTTVIRRY